MLSIVRGDIFQSRAQSLVNPVNCSGIMGKGLAVQFKHRYPEMFSDYKHRCTLGEVELGKPYLYPRPSLPWIVNFPTKQNWRSRASLEAIQTGLDWLVRNYNACGITSLAVPALGCGEGGLRWEVVLPILLQHLRNLEIPVELYEPIG